jgi:hypothetical protein
LKELRSNTDVSPSSKPRDALFGGRTNAAFVQKTKPYTYGAPKIITEVNTLDINNFFGLIQCEASSPRKLRFPILPTRMVN